MRPIGRSRQLVLNLFNELTYLNGNKEWHSHGRRQSADWRLTMTLEITRKALLWCAVINYAILLVWFLFFVLAHDRMYLLHSQ